MFGDNMYVVTLRYALDPDQSMADNGLYVQ